MSTETKGVRPVRIHLAMKDGPVPRSIRQVLPIVGDETSHTYVESQAEADLVIFDEVRAIERGYDKEKSYAFLQMPGVKAPRLPDNCEVINALCILGGLIDVISKARLRLPPPAMSAVEEEEETTVSFLPDALRILVIEDTPRHQASARVDLAGHRLTVATGYEEAMQILAREKFDYVFTDLMMPMSSLMLGTEAFKLGELVPYGIMLMIEAAHRGASYVAVVTDLNHHANWLSAAFDHFRYPVEIDGAVVMMMHAPMRKNAEGEDVKNWGNVLCVAQA